jgi:hypothetical protein
MSAQLRRDVYPKDVETITAPEHIMETSRQREIKAGILFLFRAPIDPILAIRADERTVLEEAQFGFGVEMFGECLPPASPSSSSAPFLPNALIGATMSLKVPRSIRDILIPFSP